MGCCCSRAQKQPAAPAAPEGYRPLRTARGGGGRDGGGDDSAGGGGGKRKRNGSGGGGDDGRGGTDDIPTAKPFEPPIAMSTVTESLQKPQPALGYPVPAAPLYPQHSAAQQQVPGRNPEPSLYPQVLFPDQAIKPYPGPTQTAQSGNMINLLD